MRALAGQAARHAGRMLHRLLRVALAVVVLAACGLGVLAWRLSRGELELPWLVQRLEAVDSSGDLHLSIGAAALAWEGFSRGVDRPLDIRLTDIATADAGGRVLARIPHAEISLSIGRLLLGELVPRAIAVDGAQLRAIRQRDGQVTLDLGDSFDPTGDPTAPALDAVLAPMLAELAQPPQTDLSHNRSQWSQLRRVAIRDASVLVTDRAGGPDWRAPAVSLSLDRPAAGGVDGTAAIALALAGQRAALTARVTLPAGGQTISVSAHLTEIRPAALAQAFPVLAALDAPVTLSGSAELGADLRPTQARLRAEIGAGTLRVGAGLVPFRAALLEAQGAPDAGELEIRRLELQPRADGPRSVLQGRIRARHENGQVMASATLDLDVAAVADLPVLWPEGLGGAARDWIVANITAGTARAGHVELSLRAPDDFSAAEITALSGGIEGHDLTVQWLAPVPAIEHGEASLAFRGPDEIAISVHSGRQGGTAIAIHDGLVYFTGLSGPDQFMDIDGDLQGPLADMLGVLRHPRLHLLDRSPMELRDPAGAVSGHLAIVHLPLRRTVSLDDLRLRATAQLTDVHLAGIAAGRDLDHGTLSLAADNDGMKLNGSAELAGIPAQLSAELDFRGGGAGQVPEKITVSGTADAAQLRTLGLDGGGVFAGQASVQAVLQSGRGGRGEVSVSADLAQAALRLKQLNWSKPAGRPAQAELHLLLDRNGVAGIDRLRLGGEGLELQGQIDFAGGRPAQARLARVALGRDTQGQAEITWPAAAGAPWIVTMSGTSLDASAQFGTHAMRSTADDRPGPPWRADLRFDRVVLGTGRAVADVTMHAENDGVVTRQARLTGRTSASAPFAVAIDSTQAGRRLTGSAADAGALLAALDVSDGMQGGTLSLTGRYDDSQAGHPLLGDAEISTFRMRNAPALVRLLQAMTLYGLIEVARGPGLGFERLQAPFRLTGDLLEVTDARAFSSSLGLTAKGRVDLAAQRCDLQGTIVPAYFFNTLLGGIPLLGKLLVPEKGGGVFAATYTLRGDCGDPQVAVNPLAALTPGFLRGLFGVFDGAGGATGPGGGASGGR